MNIKLPALRERGEDISLLLEHFLTQFSSENNFPTPNLNNESIGILNSYSWPGNIRELRNFCENLVVLNRGGEITPYDLDPRFLIKQMINILLIKFQINLFQLKIMKKDF